MAPQDHERHFRLPRRQVDAMRPPGRPRPSRAAAPEVYSTSWTESTVERDALRDRYVIADDERFFDHLWPDVSQDDLGVFAEYLFLPTGKLRLRLGLGLGQRQRHPEPGPAAAGNDRPRRRANRCRSRLGPHGPDSRAGKHAALRP